MQAAGSTMALVPTCHTAQCYIPQYQTFIITFSPYPTFTTEFIADMFTSTHNLDFLNFEKPKDKFIYNGNVSVNNIRCQSFYWQSIHITS
jgi:hypothetical protein